MTDSSRSASFGGPVSSGWGPSHGLAMTIFALLGLLIAFHPTLMSGFAWLQADPGDSRFNQDILEHSFRWLIRDPLHARFWDTPFFFPEPNVTAYTENLLGAAPFYWVFRALGFASDTSYQLWLMELLLLNALAVYLLLGRVFRFEALACGAGAFLFAFAGPRIFQLSHAQLLPQFWSVGVLWAIVRAAQAPAAAKWIFAAVACAVFQIYSGLSLGWYLAFSLWIAGWVCLIHPAFRTASLRFLARNWMALLLGSALGIAALLPLVRHYALAGKEVGTRGFAGVEGYAPSAQSWFYLGADSWLYRWQTHLGMFLHFSEEHEQHLGIGFVSSALALAGLLLRRRERIFQLLLFVPLIIVLVMTRFSGPESAVWYWVGYRGFPGATSIRVFGRIVLLLLLPASIGLAAFFDALLRKARALQPRWRWLTLLLLLFCMLEQGQTLTYIDKQAARSAIAEIASKIPDGCGIFYFRLDSKTPALEPDWAYQLDAIGASFAKDVPTVNGYSSNYPSDWALSATPERSSPDDPDGSRALETWREHSRLGPTAVCVVKASPGPVAMLRVP